MRVTPSFSLYMTTCAALLSTWFCGSHEAFAAYSNYNSVLLGERAAGLGGAFTALSGDPAATPFFNPATTVLMPGSRLSTSVSVYNKFETSIGSGGDFLEAPQRLNRGFFRSLPSASGTILSFKSFSAGLSILVPDYDFFTGQVKGSADTVSFLSRVDESLWIGGTFSTRLTEADSAGLSVYYASRNYSRTVNDRAVNAAGTEAQITLEEKNLTSNSVVAIFGYHRQLDPQWSVGVSYRPPSLPISGEAAFYRATTDTAPYKTDVVNRSSLRAVTKIPAKASVGFARENKGHNTLSVNLDFYEGLSYNDLPDYLPGTDQVEHRAVTNFAIGYEQILQTWLSVRFGFYTNLSSHPDPQPDVTYRQGDHVDMKGFSGNFTLHSVNGTTFTIGGYYSGGQGQSAELVGGQVAVLPKTQQVFSLLVASGFAF